MRRLADYLGVPVQTVYQWRTKRYGPTGLRVGKHIRYRPVDVERWLASLADEPVVMGHIQDRADGDALSRAHPPGVRPAAARGREPERHSRLDRRLRDNGLSERYRPTLFTNLSALFTAAQDDGLIAKNPFGGMSVRKPRPGRDKVVPWPERQVWAGQAALPERFADQRERPVVGRRRFSFAGRFLTASDGPDVSRSRSTRCARRMWSSQRPRGLRRPQSARGYIGGGAREIVAGYSGSLGADPA